VKKNNIGVERLGWGGGAKYAQIKSQSKHLLMLMRIFLLFAGNKELCVYCDCDYQRDLFFVLFNNLLFR